LAGEIKSPALKSFARGLARFAKGLAPVIEAVELLTGDTRAHNMKAPALEPTR
jgi:hypothetical protein